MFPSLFASPAIFGLPALTSPSAIPAVDLTVLAIAMATGFISVAVGLWTHQRAAASRRPSRPQPRPIRHMPIGAAAARYPA